MPRKIDPNEAEVHCEVGEELLLELDPGPPGSQWVVSSADPEVDIRNVSPHESTGAGDDVGRVGAGVKDRFRITAQRAVTTRITFEKREPWSSDSSELKQFTIKAADAQSG